ncbi:MAG TPA: hypothetical protein VF311_03660 [Terriglobales bacterium]|jgi:hypothetical protein
MSAIPEFWAHLTRSVRRASGFVIVRYSPAIRSNSQWRFNSHKLICSPFQISASSPLNDHVVWLIARELTILCHEL